MMAVTSWKQKHLKTYCISRGSGGESVFGVDGRLGGIRGELFKCGDTSREEAVGVTNGLSRDGLVLSLGAGFLKQMVV